VHGQDGKTSHGVSVQLHVQTIRNPLMRQQQTPAIMVVQTNRAIAVAENGGMPRQRLQDNTQNVSISHEEQTQRTYPARRKRGCHWSAQGVVKHCGTHAVQQKAKLSASPIQASNS